MPIQRISRDQRLRLKSDFENLRTNGFARSNSYLVIKVAPSGKSLPRFAFIVSKKVSTSSVRRNRIKRILKDIVRQISLGKNKDILIIARQSALGASHAELLIAVKDLFNKLQLLKLNSRESVTSNLN